MKKRNLILSIFLGLGLFSFTSCKPSEQPSVTETLKLQTSLDGKNFFDNGIEEVTLSHCTDGDTSTFNLKSGGSVTARYLAIDTPESTAGYEEWGKAASKWNESILTKATSIVVESNGNKPEKDTNGTRYLIYVWYKLEGDTEYKNLNLQTVEEAYSRYTGTSVSCKYDEYFNKAQSKASSEGRRIYSKTEEDIYYPTKIENVTIKDLIDNPSKYYDKETDIPTHVAFDAYLVKTSASSSGFTTVTVEQNIEGQTYQYSILAGYSGSSLVNMFDTTALKRGTLYHICGFTTSEGQLHGCVAGSIIISGDEYTTVISKKYYTALDNATITAAKISNNVATITVTYDNSTYEIALKNSTYSESELAALVGKKLTGHAYNDDATSTKDVVEMFTYTQQIEIK